MSGSTKEATPAAHLHIRQQQRPAWVVALYREGQGQLGDRDALAPPTADKRRGHLHKHRHRGTTISRRLYLTKGAFLHGSVRAGRYAASQTKAAL